MDEPKPNELYRHFKGSLYRVLATGKHSETGEAMVCYVVDGAYHTAAWFRPLVMWDEVVEHKGEQVKRFTRVQETGYPINTHFPTIPREIVDLSHTLKIGDGWDDDE